MEFGPNDTDRVAATTKHWPVASHAHDVADPSDVERLLAGNRYIVLGTADVLGNPWTTPVFFAMLDRSTVCWVSSQQSRHSLNIANRPAIAFTAFDSTVEVGHGEAAYVDADARLASQVEAEAALRALNSRLPAHKHLTGTDLQPVGPLSVYVAEVRRRYLLVRGGNAKLGNELDVTVEV